MDQHVSLDHKNRRYTYSGIITPVEWDSHDNPILFTLYTNTDEDIILVGDKFKNRLKKHLNRNVSVTGIVTKDKHGNKTMQITKMRRIKPKSKPIQENISIDDDFISGWSLNYSSSIPNQIAV